MRILSVIGDGVIAAITTAKKIRLHAFGDTGAAKKTRPATQAAVEDIPRG